MLFLTCSFIAFIEPIFIAFNASIANNATTATIDFFAGACFAVREGTVAAAAGAGHPSHAASVPGGLTA